MTTTATPAHVAHRRAKIVCTLGPATEHRLADLIVAGMDVARLNFSHGEQADHKRVYEAVRTAADTMGRTVAVLADVQGPKIRLGRFAGGPVDWHADEIVRITVDDVPGTAQGVSTTYSGLATDAEPGDRLLVDDGRIGLEVLEVEVPDVVCKVTIGGRVSDNKGLSLPGMNVSVPALSEKDVSDLEFALGLGVDLVALSFVRSPADIGLVHEVMNRVGRRTPVIAKLEKPEAVDDIESVVDVFDGIMVARGDLGVELPLERVPMVQKRAVQLRRENAVMLSGETSIGSFPLEAVRTMARIIEEVESDPTTAVPPLRLPDRTQAGLLVHAARDIAHGLDATALVAFTLSGNTVRRLARLHPRCPLIAITPNPATRNQLALIWGTQPHLVTDVDSSEEMLRVVDRTVLAIGGFAPGDGVVIVAGAPPHTIGLTDLLRVHQLGTDGPS